MAPRSFWTGYLKLSLVTCPVAMTPAVSASEKVRFHTLNRATGNRIETRYVDAETGKPVEEDEEVKGYEQADESYVVLEDEELQAIALESNRTIDIDQFVPKTEVGWIWYDKPHYLVPSDPVGEEAFSVIREAMTATGTVGLAKVVLYRRERAVMLEPRGKGIVLWTLHYGDEVRDPDDYFKTIKTASVEPGLLSLVTQLIDERTDDWSPEMVRDPVQEKLRAIIAAKKKGRAAPKKKTDASEPASNVINIMDALKKSVASEKTKRR